MDKIEVDVTLEIGDITRCTSYFIKNKVLNNIILYFLMIIDLLVYSFYRVEYAPNKLILVLSIVFGIGIFILLGYSEIYFKVRKGFETNKSIRNLNKYTFFEEEITIKSEQVNLKFQWNEIYKIVFAKRKLLIFISYNKRLLIPYRCFSNQTEIFNLKELMKRKLDDKKIRISKNADV